MGTHRLFRFGSAAYTTTSRTELLTFARKMEDFGYAICVAPDHFVPSLATSVHLMAVADATKTLRIGSYVFDNDFRHPALLAKEAATLDLLSEGRFELGMGAGYMGPDYEMTHIPLDPPGVRVARLIESVHIVKRVLAGEEVTFSGTHYQVTGLSTSPLPVQKPHPPLFIAGGGQRILSLAAREADIVGLMARSGGGQIQLSDASHESTAQRIEWIRQAAGERFNKLELNTLIFKVVVTDQRQQVAEQMSQELQLPPELILNSIHFLVGTVDQIVEDIQRWREQFSISYVCVFPFDMEAFAPVVARLTGT